MPEIGKNDRENRGPKQPSFVLPTGGFVSNFRLSSRRFSFFERFLKDCGANSVAQVVKNLWEGSRN